MLTEINKWEKGHHKPRPYGSLLSKMLCAKTLCLEIAILRLVIELVIHVCILVLLSCCQVEHRWKHLFIFWLEEE